MTEAMTELRVALVHPYTWPEVRRGGERYVEDLAVYLAGHGVDVEVVTGSSDGGSVVHRPDGVTVRRVRHVLAHRLARWKVTAVDTFGLPAWTALARRRYDVVHAMTPTGALAGRLARRPTVFTIIGHPTEEQLAYRRYDRAVFAAAFRTATVAAALSRASADQVERLFGRPAEVLGPGVRAERFTPDLAPRRGPPRILFSASVSDRRKGLDVAMLAFSRVLARHPDARLWVSGEGDCTWALDALPDEERARVVAAVDQLGTGSVDEVPARYRSASVTLLPSVEEAFGMVLVESLATGTPVVCTPSGGMPEIVAGADVGYVAERTPGALADALEHVLALAAQDGTPARCVAHSRHWEWEGSVGPAHLALYARLAGPVSGWDPEWRGPSIAA
jgi:glycosyltransferase involved in cell wall biosynthesis